MTESHASRSSPSRIRQLSSLAVAQCRGAIRHRAKLPFPRRVFGYVCVAFVLVSLLAVAPAAAQDGTTNPVCADDSDTLASMVEGFVQITTGLGIMGLLVVWQADALMEMFTMGREQKAKLKQHKRGAMRSATVLVVLGPLFTVGSAAMGLPIASCVDLIPF